MRMENFFISFLFLFANLSMVQAPLPKLWYKVGQSNISFGFKYCILTTCSDNLSFLSSPVDCIHWTSAAQLSLLEDEMRRVERVNVRLCFLIISMA